MLNFLYVEAAQRGNQKISVLEHKNMVFLPFFFYIEVMRHFNVYDTRLVILY